MNMMQEIRWSAGLGIMLILSLWVIAHAGKATDAKDKVLTQTEKELLFRENGLKKDHYFGYTNLILASLEGDLSGVTKALSKNENVNWKMQWGYTALMLAADQGHLPIVRLLIENSADPKLANGEGKTALDLARRENRTGVVAYLQSR